MQNRIAGLDIVRSQAIVLVILHHSSVLLLPAVQIPFAGWFIGKLIAITEPFGFLGVELFFVLSGFLIGKILIDTSADSFNFSEVLNFWKRRWLRTLPAFYFMLLLLGGILYYEEQIFPDLKFLFFIQNFSSPHPAFFPEAWSLAVEEWFYLGFPVWIFLSGLLFPAKNIKWRFLSVVLVFIGFFLTVRIINAFSPVYADCGSYPIACFDKGIRKIVMLRLDAIAYGVLISWLCYYYTAFINQLALMLIRISCILLLILTIVFCLGYHPGFLFYSKYPAFRFLCDGFVLFLFPFLFSLILPWFSMLKSIKNGVFARIVAFVSKISYSLYLIHFSFMFPFFNGWKVGPYASLALFLCYWIVTILVAAGMYRWIEKPFLDYRSSSPQTKC